MYTRTRFTPKGAEWPPNQAKIVVSVALIHYKGKRTQQELFEIVNIHRKGAPAVDNLLSSTCQGPSTKKPRLNYSKVTKNVTDIFAAGPTDLTETGTSSTKAPKRILIEGAPGIGKTVLAKEIAYRWATNEILTETKIVFLLYLRDPRLQSITTTKQLVEYMCMGCLDNEKITIIDNYFANTEGQQMCIVMDGFDEYPSLLQKDSFIVDIFKGTVLPEAIVVITSRPTATVSLHDWVDRRIDILGLPKEEREKYISEIFSDSSEKKVELDKYLKQQPVINGLCYVPLHLTILLYLFQQGSLPETLTEMNKSFILHTIYRHLEKDGLAPCGPIVKLADIPKPVLDIVYNLSELAFKGLKENKLVFTFDEIKQVCPCINEAVNGFGLLQAVEHYPHKGAGTTKSFNFLHYTMQEFLAALHVSNLPSEQQSSLMEKTFWDGHCNFMWIMFVGIVGIKSDIFVNFISKGKVYKRKSGVRIADNIRNDKRKLLHVFQCYLESKENTEIPEVISSMFKDGKVIFSYVKLLPHNITSLMSFISTKQSVQWKSLELQQCKIGDIGMSVLQQFISENTSTLEYVDLSHSESSPWGVYSAIIRNCSANSLTLCGDDGIEDYVNEIKEALQTNTQLISLILRNIIKHGMISIAEAIQVNTTLKNLDISGNNISDAGAAAISDSLTSNSSLAKLNISSNNITSEGAKKIAQAIQVNTILKKLDISSNNISDAGVAAISDSLKRNSSLAKLNMSRNNIISEGAKKIAQAIQVNTTLKKLDLSFNKITDDGTTFISNGLKYNNSLQKLNMFRNGITSQGAKMISEALQVNTTPKQLDLSINKICDDGATAISNGLTSNISLQVLNISHNSISNRGIKQIAEDLQINTTLQNINISKNHISIEGLLYFMQAVKNNCTLQVVNITHNNVTRSEFTSIKQCIENLHQIQIYASWNEIHSMNGELSIVTKIPNNILLESKNVEENVWSFEDYDPDHMVTCLSECLKEDDTLLELNLSRNTIISGREKKIIEAIKVNETLQKLDLSFTKMFENFLFLSECLEINKSLTELDMSNTEMNSEGAKKIAKAIRVNMTLKKLDLSFNKITDDGVTFISDGLKYNNSLQELDMSSNNINITSEGVKMIVEALQVNTTLKQLDLSINKICDDGAAAISNGLTSNISLQVLNISHNSITNRGIKKIAEAIQINSTLQNINISKNYISIEGLLYFMEVVKNNCTLQVVNITHNNVTRSEFTSIKQCIENLQHQIQIYASWNEIHSMNGELSIVTKIPNNILLEFKNAEENVWSFEDYDPDHMVTCLSECLKEDDTLLEINLSRNTIVSGREKKIIEAIKVNETLQKLDLSFTKMFENFLFLSECLEINKSLTELDMSNTEMNSEGAKKIAKAIRVNMTLKKLDLSFNKITDDGVTFISDGLKYNNSLQELNMSSNNINITSEGVKMIVEALQVNTTLKQLDLSINKICDDGAAAISNGLTSNISLQVLNISHNSITNRGIKKIAEAIQINSTLQNINISKNYVSIEGLLYFMEVVKNNCTLQVVNITHNNVTRSGFTSIIRCIKNLQQIQISTSWNEINKNGKLLSKIYISSAPDNIKEDAWLFEENDPDHLVMCLSECLKEDNTLQELDLDNKMITNEGAKKIGEAIQVNTTLQKLDISSNTISDDGVAAISDGLKSNNSLQVLYMSRNKITSEGAKKIGKAIQVNKTLHTLDLYQYDINDKLSFIMSILAAMYHNNTLLKLSLPIVYGDDDRLVSNEVEKINKERTRQGISTLTCDYWWMTV